jgi:phosphonate transport system substrate-binding protein
MKRLRTWAAVFAVSGLVLAGCGDDGDDTDDDTTGSDGTEEDADDDSDEGEEDPTADWPEQLVLTLTPSAEQQGLIETAEPLAVLLEERLGVDIEPFVPTDYAGVIVGLESGQAHIAGGLGPRQMVQAEDQAGADLILQSERFGDVIYVTQWFTNDPDTYCNDDPVDVEGMLFCNGVDQAAGPGDGPIGADALASVAGQGVAFVDQGSTSGYGVPALQLFQAGIDPVDDIDGTFAGSHDNAVLAVYNGDASVGVSFNDARGNVVEQFPDVGEKVVVFGWSNPIPNDGFAVAADLPDDLKQAIVDAFLDIAASEDGVALLQELYNIDDLIPVDSSAYDVIRTLETELGDLLVGD